MTAITVTTTATPHTTTTNRDNTASYIIKKDVTYRNILRRNKKSPKLSLELLTETDLANSTTNLKNNSTNISWITKIIIPTQKKSLRKLFKH